MRYVPFSFVREGHVMAVAASSVEESRGKVRLGVAVVAGCVALCYGTVGIGLSWQLWHVQVLLVMFRTG